MTTYFETSDDAGLDADTPKLNVLLVYEDPGTGLRIKQAFERVVARLEPKVGYELNAWRFERLRDPVLRNQAAIESSKTDIFMLSAHGKAQLPEDIKACFRQWLGRKCDDRPHALVVSLDSDAKQSAEAAETLADLRSLAEKTGLDLFTHFGQAPRSETEWILKSIRQGVNTTSEVLESILHNPTPPSRGWGLNE